MHIMHIEVLFTFRDARVKLFRTAIGIERGGLRGCRSLILTDERHGPPISTYLRELGRSGHGVAGAQWRLDAFEAVFF